MGTLWVPPTKNGGPAPDFDPYVFLIVGFLFAAVAAVIWMACTLGLLP